MTSVARPSPPPSAMRRLARRRRRWQLAGLLFVLPALIFYVVFMIYPFISNLYLSLVEWNGLSKEKTFVGFDNYARLLGDDAFWQSLAHNLIWVLLGTLIPLVIGLGLAMALWSRPRGFHVFRTVIFMPQVLPTIVVAIMFAWIYDPSYGILNRTLDSIGLGGLSIPWLADPGTALFAVLFAGIWVEVGFPFVVFLAALQNVDRSLLDAAEVDGANAWNKFRHVTIPQLANAITLVVVLLLISGFNVFDYVWVLTQGGPNRATELTATYMYKEAFRNTDIGYGAAIAAVMTATTLVISVVVVRWRERSNV